MTELNWNYANDWEDNANSKKQIHGEPKWRFDSGFKLDFDGSLITLSSRFYPPNKNFANLWEGYVIILFLGEEIMIKEFKSDTLDMLKTEVEEFAKLYADSIKSRIKI